MSTPPPLNSALAIFGSAEAFSEAADKLTDQLKKEPPKAYLYATQAPHVQPCAVVDSFAAELYLKCLYVIDHGKTVNGHHLAKLFAALTAGTQAAIRSQYNNRLHSDPITDYLNKNHPGFSPSLDNVLDLSSDVFTKLRYLHEGTGKAKSFYWPMLRLALRDTVLAIHPEWRAIPAK